MTEAGNVGHLTLSRVSGESIFIGDDIKVEVVEVVKGRKVKIKITAPLGVSILREELLDKIKKGEVPKE